MYFIPVHMIKTSEYVDRLVYPCVYREHQVSLHHIECFIGLSLCIQGTYFPQGIFDNHMRFIPVYTGNINARPKQRNTKTVYPCVYREHKKSSNFCRPSSGLSLCIQGT